MDRLGWRAWPRAVAFAAVGAMLLSGSAIGKTPAEEDAEISGINTPEATSLDREADKLLEQSQKADGEASALLARAGAKIDLNAMRERLQRGDRSVLFETTPEEKKARERQAQARTLKDQAYAKAREAADKRAHAAVEQRCKASAATQDAQSADRSSSPFLSSAVRGGGAKRGPNDPWDVCSSAEQYLEGLKSEIEGIQSRAQGFVGKSWWGSIIPADEIERKFGRRPLAQLIAMRTDGIRKGFEEDAAAIQRDLAKWRLDEKLGKLGGRGYKNNDRDFSLAVHGAHALVHKAVAAAWEFHREEFGYSSVILSTEIEEHQKSLFDVYVEQRNTIWDSVVGDVSSDKDRKKGRIVLSAPKEWDHAALVAYLAALKPLAKSYDQADFRYIEETILKTRSIASKLRDARKRLSSDMGHWISFAAKDGTDLVNSRGEIFSNVQDLKFKIHSSRLGYYGGIPWYREWEGEQNDAEWRIWADMPKDFRHKYPELSWDLETWNQGGQVNVMTLTYHLGNDDKRVAEAVVSGAHPSQRP